MDEQMSQGAGGAQLMPELRLPMALAQIFHAWIEQRSGEGVIRLVSPSQNENTTHRFFWYRL
jgi:hypothetical protein